MILRSYSSIRNILHNSIINKSLSFKDINNTYIYVQQMGFFSNPFTTKSNKILEYSEHRTIGFPRDQIYSVVADVERYASFVPFCTRSHVESDLHGVKACTLEVGFPPVTEQYTSFVTSQRPYWVKSHASNTRMFKDLKTIWKFTEKKKNHQPNTCVLHFTVSFEFKSAMYTKLAQVFFDELVHSNVEAFLKRTEHVYGKPEVVRANKVVVRHSLSS